METNETTAETAAETTAETTAHHHGKRLRFYQKMLIYCGVWLLITLIACGVMWNVMLQYEAAQPWYTVERYLENLQQSDFYSALMQTQGGLQNPYESTYEIAGLLSNRYRGNLTYQKQVRESTSESPVYLLQYADESIFKLTLVRGGSTGFLGLTGYRVKSCEVLDAEWTTPHTLRLIYPKNATVSIGGIPLAAEDKKTYTPSPFFADPDFVTCEVPDFLLPPTVKITLDGTALTGSGEWERFYDYPEARLRTLSVSAPAGADLTLGGLPLTDTYKTEMTATVADRFGGEAQLEVYAVETVFKAPVLTATLDGRPLQVLADTYTALPEPQQLSAILPDGAVLYANGIPVTDAETRSDPDTYSDLFGGAKGTPSATVYTLGGLYAAPTLTARLDGEDLTCSAQGETPCFTAPASEALKAAYGEQAVAFMNAYLHYTTQGYVNTRGNLDAVLALTAYKSPLYNALSGSYIGYMYIAPQKMTVELLEADNFIPYGAGAFTCEIRYKLTLRNFVGTTEEENTVRIAFLQNDDEFEPVHMTFLQS